MVSLPRLLPTLIVFSYATTCLASSWRFTDATLSVQGKGTGVGGGFKEKSALANQFVASANQIIRLAEHKPLSAPVIMGASDSLKIVLTVQDGKTAKRPHQAFLILKDADTGLDISYPFSVKDSGKAKIDLVELLHSLCRTWLTLERLTRTSLLNFSDRRNQLKQT